MYYMCSENKGADQLRSYSEADMHLCFHMQIVGFLMMGLKFPSVVKRNVDAQMDQADIDIVCDLYFCGG